MNTRDEKSSSENSYIEAFEQHPHFNHPFHPPHPLIRQSSLKKYWCASCHKCFENEHYYHCSECRFTMDLKCVFMDPIEVCEGQPHIQHISHQHPMLLVKISPNDQVVCFACQSPCLSTTPVYACAACNYCLHKRCGELPLYDMMLRDFSPPDDNIPGLLINHEKQASCGCCGRNNACFFIWRDKFLYEYDHCICIDCYILPTYLNQYNFHSIHDCCRLPKLIDQYVPPRVPQFLKKYVPKRLNKFLSELLNQYRPNLTLSMLSTNKHADHPEDLQCRLCHVRFKSGVVFCYECTACGFVIDVECALTPPVILEGEEYYRHFNHPHPMICLTFLENDDGDEEVDEYCSACDSPCSGLVYSCTKCKFFLHKSCALLPLMLVTHPLHKHSLLTQLPYTKLSTEKVFCSVCYKKDCGILFQCTFVTEGHFIQERRCDFVICGRCIWRSPNIKYEGHEQHLLCLVDNVHDKYLECKAYDGYCKLPATSDELCSTESAMFRCIDCDFNVHFLCGPLPRIIKYKYHIHSLILFDSVIDEVDSKDDKEDDLEEYYCDICERKRDPHICGYYCQECKYFAHVHCLKSEVITVLKGDLRNVELKTVKIHNNRHNSTLRLDDILRKLPENEATLLQCEFNLPDRLLNLERSRSVNYGLVPFVEKQEVARYGIQIIVSRFNTEYFEKLIDWLYGFCYLESLELDEKFSLDEKIDVVEGYMVHKTVARILQLFLRRHGDVSTNSPSTLEMKSITFCFLCRVLDSMARTRIRHVTIDHLKEWYFYLKYAQNRGFEIQFMFDHLRDVVRSFIALQATEASCTVHDIKNVKAYDIQWLQEELASSLRSLSDINLVKCGEFIFKCLSVALELGLDNYVADTLF